MNVSVNEEDIFFACALALNIPLEQITGIGLEYGFIGEHAFNIIRVEIQSDKTISLYFPRSVKYTEWAYNLLQHKGVWRKNEHTHH